MKKKLLIISILAAISISTVFTGCGSGASTNTTNINQNVFNEATAKTDSKKALEDFLNSHKNGEVLVNSKEPKELKSYIDKNFSKYFTSDFLNDTDNDLQTGFSYEKINLFYMDQGVNSINFKSDYLLYSPTIDKENKTVIYEIKDNSGMSYHIEMKQENGKWKINKIGN